MFKYVGTPNSAHRYTRRKEIASLRGRDTPSSAAIAGVEMLLFLRTKPLK